MTVTSEHLACPKCGATDQFLVATNVRQLQSVFVHLENTDEITYETRDDPNYVEADALHTALKCLACDFHIEAEPEHWGDEFFPKPDIEGLLALRARMKGDAPASSGDEVADQGAPT